MSFLSEKNKHTIYCINTYEEANNNFIKKNKIVIDDVNELINILETNKGYHFRVHKKTQYIFFVLFLVLLYKNVNY
jgi:hypothetical protein